MMMMIIKIFVCGVLDLKLSFFCKHIQENLFSFSFSYYSDLFNPQFSNHIIMFWQVVDAFYDDLQHLLLFGSFHHHHHHHRGINLIRFCSIQQQQQQHDCHSSTYHGFHDPWQQMLTINRCSKDIRACVCVFNRLFQSIQPIVMRQHEKRCRFQQQQQ